MKNIIIQETLEYESIENILNRVNEKIEIINKSIEEINVNGATNDIYDKVYLVVVKIKDLLYAVKARQLTDRQQKEYKKTLKYFKLRYCEFKRLTYNIYLQRKSLQQMIKNNVNTKIKMETQKC